MRGTLCALLLVSLSAAAPARAPRPQQRVLVEEIQIEGNRRLTDEEVLGHVRMRPGDPYDERRMHRDLRSLLDLGLFDPGQTRVSVHEGLRGGKVVVFEVSELPLVSELRVRGLPRGLREAEVLRAAAAGGRGLRAGGTYGAEAAGRALESVRALLARRGLSGVSADVWVEEIRLGHVSVAVEFTEGRRF